MIHKIPINNAIILIDEFNYQYNNNIYKNLLTYLDTIREHNNVITFIICNELNFHRKEIYKSLFRDGRIDVKSFFIYCITGQKHKMLKFFFLKKTLKCRILKISYPQLS